MSPSETGRGPFPVSAAYTTKGTTVANARIALAAARLQRLLNDI